MNPAIMIPMLRKQLPKMIARDIVGVQPMASPHNKRYWPYQALVNWRQIKEVERWCYSCMKSSNWRNHGQFFAFKREADFVAFTLRWA